MKLAVLYSLPGSYTRACLRELRERHGWEILAIHHRRSREAPFASEPLQGIATWIDRASLPGAAAITERVSGFLPDVVLMAGWMDKGYLGAAWQLRRRHGIPVVAGSDGQYTGSVRQWFAGVTARYHLHHAIDVLWVTGERQRQLAWRLGYRGERCWSGMYCCDWSPFAAAGNGAGARDPAFLYVGRYVERKGLHVLLEAYDRYRKTSKGHPWTLLCAGAGPLKNLLHNREGIVDLGFIQPKDLPALMARCAAFVLPSRREPWGVVLQEAAATRLPLICSDAVGAGVHLLQENHNGWFFEDGSVRGLARCLGAMSALPSDRRDEMGRRSVEMSLQFLPARWARTLVDGVSRLDRMDGSRHPIETPSLWGAAP